MSFSTLSTDWFDKNLNKKTEYLVYGYIRMIGSVIKDKIIPLSIMKICVIFYYYPKSTIIYIKHNPWPSRTKPTIRVAQLDKNKNYQCDIKFLNENESLQHRHHSYDVHVNCGICYVKNFCLP